MTQLCETCGHYYNDEQSWTICPHGPLWAPVEAYCREHDLVNCKLHGDGTVPYVAPIAGTSVSVRKAKRQHPHWDCSKCGTSNELDRDECWKCRTPWGNHPKFERDRPEYAQLARASGAAFIATTWCGSRVNIRGRFWPWLFGWLRGGWRPMAFRMRRAAKHPFIDFTHPETGEQIHAHLCDAQFCDGKFIGYVANDIRDGSKLYGGLFPTRKGWEMKALTFS